MSKEVSVIVSPCVKNTEPNENRIFGDRLVDKTFLTLKEAMEEGALQCRDGRSVVVRPNYNETDPHGSFFREWRSFNGEVLKEVRFPFEPVSLGREDIFEDYTGPNPGETPEQYRAYKATEAKKLAALERYASTPKDNGHYPTDAECRAFETRWTDE